MERLHDLLFILVLSSNLLSVVNCQEKKENQIILEKSSEYLPLNIGNIWNYSTTVVTKTMEQSIALERVIIDTNRRKDGSIVYSFTDYYDNFKKPSKPIITGYYGYDSGTIFTCNYLDSSKEIILKSSVQTEKDCASFFESIISHKSGESAKDTLLLVVRRWKDVTDSAWYARGIGLIKRRAHHSHGFYQVDLHHFEVQK